MEALLLDGTDTASQTTSMFPFPAAVQFIMLTDVAHHIHCTALLPKGFPQNKEIQHETAHNPPSLLHDLTF